MNNLDAAMKVATYKAKCAAIRTAIGKLDRDYEEVCNLSRKISRQQNEFAEEQNRRASMLSGAHTVDEINAFRDYRDQMSAYLKGPAYTNVMNGLDTAMKMIEREKNRIQMESENKEADLRYAEYMCSYWQQQVNNGI